MQTLYWRYPLPGTKHKILARVADRAPCYPGRLDTGMGGYQAVSVVSATGCVIVYPIWLLLSIRQV